MQAAPTEHAPWLHLDSNGMVFFDPKGTKRDALQSGTQEVSEMPAAEKTKSQEAK